MAGGRRKDGERREPVFDADSEEEAPSPRPNPRKRGKRKGNNSKKSRFSFGRLVYWSFVFALWLVIAGIGGAIWIGAHLPPIQSLEIPKRPPSIQLVGIDGRVLTTRGDGGGEVLSLKELPPYLPKAFVAIEDRRFYSHFGVDPHGISRAI